MKAPFKSLFLGLLALFLGMQAAWGRDFNILDHGAVGDGTTLNTTAIQATIDAASAAGGGRVIVPKGRFLSGGILLKSHVELHLEPGAVLLGSTNRLDYTQFHPNTCVGFKALVMAFQAQDIAVTGKGTIDGQGGRLAMGIDSLFYIGQIDSVQYELPERRPKWFLRPQVIQFFDCQRVRVQDVTVKNSACWVQVFVLCQDLEINRVRVEGDDYWNNDGIDIVDCQRVRITDCDINTSDDGICLKSYLDFIYYTHPTIKGCDSIYIGNCRIRSSASAIKFGSASFGGFRNVHIEDIETYDTFRSAIALEMVGGGILQDVLVQRVRGRNIGNAIFLRLGQMHRQPGILRNILIRDMDVTIASDHPDKGYRITGPALPFFHNPFPASIVGLPGHPIENVTLENITISYPGGGLPNYANMPLWRIHLIPELEKK